jgi:DNA replication protein DnaC
MAKSQPDAAVRAVTCPTHGDFESRNLCGPIWSRCPTCEGDSVAEYEAEERRERMHKRLERSGLRGRYADSTFANFVADTKERRAVLTACRAYTENFTAAAGGLWLIGPPGTGKTHLGAAMVNDLIRERNTAAMLFSGREIIRQLRATWHTDSALSEADVLARLGLVPLLVIDEIGVGSGSDVEHAQLFDVVDERYVHGNPTVILSNLPAEQLKQAMGHRAYDRLREGAKLLSCNWESRRGAR